MNQDNRTHYPFASHRLPMFVALCLALTVVGACTEPSSNSAADDATDTDADHRDVNTQPTPEDVAVDVDISIDSELPEGDGAPDTVSDVPDNPIADADIADGDTAPDNDAADVPLDTAEEVGDVADAEDDLGDVPTDAPGTDTDDTGDADDSGGDTDDTSGEDGGDAADVDCGPLSSDEHCGRCGNACTGDLSCVEERCQCAEGLAQCWDACVDVAGDPANCGACGIACDADQTCRDGQCRVLCQGEVCAPRQVCTDAGCAHQCGAAVEAPVACDVSSPQVTYCQHTFDADNGLSRTGLGGANCLDDGSTPHCVYDEACPSGCIRDLSLIYDFGEKVVATGLRYQTDWHNKAPRDWELWVSNDPVATPQNGATLVASGEGERSPWQCTSGESCQDPQVPDVCCPNGRDQPQDTTAVGGHYAKYNTGTFDAAEGRYWTLVVRDTHTPRYLLLFDMRLTCEIP